VSSGYLRAGIGLWALDLLVNIPFAAILRPGAQSFGETWIMAGQDILIIDDDLNILQVMQIRLGIMGYRVVTCDNPLDAISVFEKGNFSVALTDQRMKGLKGIELAKELHKKDPYLPVIIMTAYASVEDAVDSVSGGAFTYLEKPVDADELGVHLKKALEKRALDQSMARERETWMSVFAGLGAGLILLDADINIVWMNPIARQLLSVNGDCRGRPCSDVVSQEQFPCDSCLAKAAFSSDQIQTIEHFDSPNGRWFLITATPVRDSEGHVIQALELILEITELKRAQEILLEQERLKGVIEMAGAAAHELSQPMQVILGWGELLKKRLNKDAPDYRMMESICEQIEKLAQLTTEIGRVTRYVKKEYPGTSGIIDINQAVGPD
jgi:FixJ family two-component response regulator